MRLEKTVNKNVYHKKNNYFAVHFNTMCNCIFRSYNNMKSKKRELDEGYMSKFIKEQIVLRWLSIVLSHGFITILI